jgi:hypothetical protein
LGAALRPFRVSANTPNHLERADRAEEQEAEEGHPVQRDHPLAAMYAQLFSP